jgi:antirestriction protein ArdC
MVDVNKIVTDRICDLLERGVVPWRRPWTGNFPTNYDSGKEYQGINTLLLGGTALAQEYKSPYWLTFRQAQKHGGHVKAGEHGSIIVWKESGYFKSKDDAGETIVKPFFYMKYYTVFNLEQCQGVPDKVPPMANVTVDQSMVERCEAVIQGMPTPPRFAIGQEAAYHPRTDIVELPSMEYFESVEAYYSTKYHELTHSTGTAHRLSRPGVTDGARFGTHKYSHEELVAEMGAAYLCARAGIDCPAVTENSAAYMASWLRTLSADKTVLLKAAGKSSAAVEYILTGKVPVRSSEAAPMATA